MHRSSLLTDSILCCCHHGDIKFRLNRFFSVKYEMCQIICFAIMVSSWAASCQEVVVCLAYLAHVKLVLMLCVLSFFLLLWYRPLFVVFCFFVRSLIRWWRGCCETSQRDSVMHSSHCCVASCIHVVALSVEEHNTTPSSMSSWDIERFSEFFHWQTWQTIRNKMIVNVLTTLQDVVEY